MKRILFVAVALTAFTFAAAAEDTAFSRYPNALGAQFAGSFASGEALGGLSYQRWLGGGLGVQTLAGASVSQGGSYRYNAAAALQYKLFADDFNSWFSGALYLNGLLGHSGQGYGGVYAPGFFAGAGIGIESVVLGHLANSIEFMYLAQLSPMDEYPFSLGFALGGSLRYRF